MGLQSRLPPYDCKQPKSIFVIISASSFNSHQSFRPSLTELYALKQELELEEGILDVSLGVCHSAVITSIIFILSSKSKTKFPIEQGMLFTAGLGTEGQLGGWIDEDTENALIVSHDSNSGRELEDASMEESQRSNAERTEKYCYLFYVPEFGADNKAIQVACGDNFTLVLDGKKSTVSRSCFIQIIRQKSALQFRKGYLQPLRTSFE